MASLTKDRKVAIEIAVVDLLSDFGITEFPMSIRKVTEALGIDLIPCSSLSEKERELANAASNDAFHARTWDFSHASIVFDDTNGAYFHRSRFSGGHEIGHIVLEHREDTPNCEREADYFAGYLLAPHPLIISRHQSCIDLANAFGVSADCACFANDQAQARKREGGQWRPHEQWLIDNAFWKGGGLNGRV